MHGLRSVLEVEVQLDPDASRTSLDLYSVNQIATEPIQNHGDPVSQ